MYMYRNKARKKETKPMGKEIEINGNENENAFAVTTSGRGCGKSIPSFGCLGGLSSFNSFAAKLFPFFPFSPDVCVCPRPCVSLAYLWNFYALCDI